MHLQTLRPSVPYDIGDITLYKNGMATFRSDIIKRFNLENRDVLLVIDSDDKENNFIYLSIDESGNDANSFKVIKKKTGSFQKSLGRLSTIFCTNGIKKITFFYSRKIINGNKPYFVFAKNKIEKI